jgi:hypothetical protein
MASRTSFRPARRVVISLLPAAALLALAPVASAWRVVSVTDYGAVADNATDNTVAFRAALAAVAADGGGEVIVPALGIFKTAPVNLTSNVRLNVLGTMWGVENSTLFPLVPPLPSYDSPDGMPGLRHHPFVWAVGATNVSIVGSGEINGAGPYWWMCGNPPVHCYAINRPHILELNNVTGVEVTGVTLRNSAFWTFRPVYSTNVWIHDMAISNPWCNEGGMNTDGIVSGRERRSRAERDSCSWQAHEGEREGGQRCLGKQTMGGEREGNVFQAGGHGESSPSRRPLLPSARAPALLLCSQLNSASGEREGKGGREETTADLHHPHLVAPPAPVFFSPTTLSSRALVHSSP